MLRERNALDLARAESGKDSIRTMAIPLLGEEHWANLQALEDLRALSVDTRVSPAPLRACLRATAVERGVMGAVRHCTGSATCAASVTVCNSGARVYSGTVAGV